MNTDTTKSVRNNEFGTGPSVSLRGVVWALFAAAALILLDTMNLSTWAVVISVSALLLSLVPALRPSGVGTRDGRDLLAVVVLYAAVVATFRAAFVGFTTDNVLGLFLMFALGLLIGTVGPIVYQVWVRGRDLRSLGIGLHRFPETLVVGLMLAGAQFVVTFWGYALPQASDWVPLLVMSLVVGLFEAVFFRGFIQGRLEASFGAGPAVAGAALLYSLYHVGYGMGVEEVWFLFGLGIVYAVAFRLTRNILIIWPLLTPIGAFFNNLQAGDIDLPWASIAGFADVAAVIAVAIWLAHRHIRKHSEVRAEPAMSPRVRSPQ